MVSFLSPLPGNALGSGVPKNLSTVTFGKIASRHLFLSFFGVFYLTTFMLMSSFKLDIILLRPCVFVVSFHRSSLSNMCFCGLSLQHVFLWSEPSKSVWAYSANWFHSVVPFADTIAHTLGFWRQRHTRTNPRHISFLIHCLIVWFIWSERNCKKHRDIHFRSAHVIWQVTHKLQLLVTARKLLPKHWIGCYPHVPFMPVADPIRWSLRPLRVSGGLLRHLG